MRAGISRSRWRSASKPPRWRCMVARPSSMGASNMRPLYVTSTGSAVRALPLRTPASSISASSSDASAGGDGAMYWRSTNSAASPRPSTWPVATRNAIAPAPPRPVVSMSRNSRSSSAASSSSASGARRTSGAPMTPGRSPRSKASPVATRSAGAASGRRTSRTTQVPLAVTRRDAPGSASSATGPPRRGSRSISPRTSSCG